MAYHDAIRKVRKSERIATSMLSNNSCDFWAEIKRIRSKSSGVGRVVDRGTDN